MEVQVRHRDDLGRERLVSPRALHGAPVEEWPVLHEQRPYKGRRSKVRQYWSSTTKKSFVCRSLEQRDAAMVLDRDPDIAYLSASCLQLEWSDGARAGVVDPAFLARTVGGQRRLYLYARGGREPGEQEVAVAWAAGREAGWQVGTARVPDGQLRRNLYLVSHFRHDENADEEARVLLLQAFAQPRPLCEGADGLALPRSLCWYLLWTGELTTHWGLPLIPTSLVWAAAEAA
ncbi:hypothetical protein OOK29_32850 [Streptomyces phaeochromogenes]|uniref:hypothetical protein n=1 Tax=Streptomyces phaeochromogenes TaxID=1923 RepID=UPI00225257C8|nr:hypothetical protein [Streptomyces phaeochromogenes]MCX5602936.1 hypothetical protein [Streptomyces phaeochromogenes]